MPGVDGRLTSRAAIDISLPRIAAMTDMNPSAMRCLFWGTFLGLFATVEAPAAETTVPPSPAVVADKGQLALESIASARFSFAGVIGERLRANIDHWVLVAPDANPGLLEMFRRRDREPVPQLVPWAGEFIGKYLVSAIPQQRMVDDPRLQAQLRRVVDAFLKTQADDGYLGPFPQADRLRGNWDLWGHYHAILALLMWHQDTGDPRALTAATRAADLVCKLYLDTDRRVFDAGSHEMNMAIIHGLGWLYRLTGHEPYLRMMREIEKDWEQAGDYARCGARGVPFYQTPRPRWESLHDLQGLVELYRITGEESYRSAFVRLWRSIAQYDRHPSGGFSTGERAVGNPYQEGAIETCCTTAWSAMSVDMLCLTGDPRAADELELSLWNSVLGSQHPSGRWWTYNTPVNGVREASAHTIVFQSRAGTPELNCCSVNAPRGISLLADWAVQRDRTGLLLNYYGPCEMTIPWRDGTTIRLCEETVYPLGGQIGVIVHVAQETRFSLRLRVPSWSRHSQVRVNGQPCESAVAPAPGTYFAIERNWRDGDKVELELDMTPRHWSGALGRAGRAALYAGPILLAFDSHFNSVDTTALPPIDLAAAQLKPIPASAPPGPGEFAPWQLWQVLDGRSSPVFLCDFASAGAHGTDYAAWLPVVNADPPPPLLTSPLPDQAVAAGPVLFAWRGRYGAPVGQRTFSLIVSRDALGADVVYRVDDLAEDVHVMREHLPPGTPYYWQVITRERQRERQRERANDGGPRAFGLDPQVPNTAERDQQLYRTGPGQLLAASPLDGNGDTPFGLLESAQGVQPAADRWNRAGKALDFAGEKSGVWYRVAEFPLRDYTFHAWVRPGLLSTDRLQQVFSAWCAGGDDPLRVVLQGNRLFARIEGGQFFSTPGVTVERDRWLHITAVKAGPMLSLFVDGKRQGSVPVPEVLTTGAQGFALGANPHYTGANECLQGTIDEFAFLARALSAEEIARLFEASNRPE
jgi:DUF1680 family protein